MFFNHCPFEEFSEVFCLKGASMNELYMKEALSLAKRAQGRTNPNPMVGCVIVKDDRVIARGYHHHCGGVHAEVDALMRAKEDVSGATMYVTLEPCSHHGKQPPCCEAIAKSNVKKVVVATLDPNPIVHGRGISYLKDHGIDIEVGVCEDEAINMNKKFNHFITHKTPYVLIKAAITLDGKIATKTGESQWISGPESLAYVHELRDEYASIGVGVNTIIVDNPSLTIRLPNQEVRCHHRIVFDSKGRIPFHSKVLNDEFASNTIIITTSAVHSSIRNAILEKGAQVHEVSSLDGHVDMKEAMKLLGSLGIDSIFLEGGGEIIASTLKAQLVHEVHIALAPKLIGGQDAKGFMGDIGVESLSQAIQLEFIEVDRLGPDILIKAKVVT
jgi:diaminohydroxyphosphoribosylaminopyrimidine deaminase / 5-amino-6-(5-phosphoribosylamino)uracil reductase